MTYIKGYGQGFPSKNYMKIILTLIGFYKSFCYNYNIFKNIINYKLKCCREFYIQEYPKFTNFKTNSKNYSKIVNKIYRRIISIFISLENMCVL